MAGGMTVTRVAATIILSLAFVKQGISEDYISPKGDSINLELGLSGGYSHFAYKFRYREIGYEVPVAAHETAFAEDTVSGRLSGRYYFGTRFTHPDVPFDFIPYNYRVSFIDFSTGLARAKFSIEKSSGSSTGIDETRTLGDIALSGALYGRYVFAEGSFSYSGFLDPGRNRELSVAAVAGPMDWNYRIGIGAAVVKRYWGPYRYWWSDETLAGGAMSAEFTPSPYVRYRCGALWIHDLSEVDYWELEIPVSASFTLRPSWLEFTPMYVYYRDDFGLDIHTVSLQVTRYSRIGSAYARVGYTSEDDSWSYPYDDIESWRVGVGGYYLIDGYLQIGMHYLWWTGEDVKRHWSLTERDRNSHGINITLKLLD